MLLGLSDHNNISCYVMGEYNHLDFSSLIAFDYLKFCEESHKVHFCKSQSKHSINIPLSGCWGNFCFM